MSVPGEYPLPLQVLLWGAGNSVAGAITGLAVVVFRGGAFDPRTFVVSVVFANVVGFTAFVCSVGFHERLRDMSPAIRFVLLGLGLLSGAGAGTSIVVYLFPLFFLADLRQTFALAAINSVLALLVGTVAYAYEGMRWRLSASLREVEHVRLVEAKLKEHAARAELAALQARINPHFFFNTLNTISSLVRDDPDRAEEVVQTLADLFRYTFKAADSGPVTLGEELDFVERYLAIERARFGDRLRVAWDVAAETRAATVPGLILQPLVENAVGHGLAPVPGGGTVRVTAHAADGRLRVEVADDGAGLKGPADSLLREDHALGNVRRRLWTQYPGRASFTLERNASGRGTVARLDLPFEPCGTPAAAGRKG